MLRTRRPTAFSRKAITLIELVIVLMVMGIMAAVAVPRYIHAMHGFRVEAAAKRIAADLNLARQNAMTKGGAASGEWVKFYVFTDRYQLLNDPDLDRPSSEYWVDLRETGYPVDLVSVTITNTNSFPSDTIKYDMYGCAKTGWPPLFPDARLATGQIVIASGSEQRTVLINAATGEASVQ